MTDRFFIDTNVVIYACDASLSQAQTSISLLAQRPVISVQVINEVIAVSLRKLKRPVSAAHEVAEFLMTACDVVAMDAQDVRLAMQLTQRYQFSHWDALIVATALRADCSVLYSEDMQHGLWITPTLQILNPFAE